ncbi:hypothetical protein BDV93DRAFT_176045 [Ceratobasidium sp. AG-I]|nr:hypothetical protein BDV93DRAFT_176045 [Ceratobasidium sp. AG-I]
MVYKSGYHLDVVHRCLNARPDSDTGIDSLFSMAIRLARSTGGRKSTLGREIRMRRRMI